jgi:CSLREA domain-containing protein
MRKSTRRLIGCVGVVAAAVIGPAGAEAATIKVSTLADEFGGENKCSLREAVQTANLNSDFGGCARKGGGAADTITLRGGKTYHLTLPFVEDLNAGGDLDVIGELEIAAAGSGRATIDVGGNDRVLEVRPGAELVGSNLVVSGGEIATDRWGAGIYSEGRLILKRSIVRDNLIGAGLGSPGGGAIASLQNHVTVLSRTTLTQNRVENLGGGGGVWQGGGVLKVTRSTIDDNIADHGGGIAALSADVTIIGSTISNNAALDDDFGGGGIYTYWGMGPVDPMRMTNSTVSTNRSGISGGGMMLSGLSTANLNAVTVTLNTADFDGGGGAGGGIYGGGSPVTVENSIVADNVAPTAGNADCYQVSTKRSVVGKATGCGNFRGIEVKDPKLGPLENNGGPTKTHALKRKSRAIGAAARSSPPRDQRGRKRDSDPDAGSFERGASN